MPHLDDAVIAEYIDTAELSRDHERHLGDCAECRARVEKAVQVREQARTILHGGVSLGAPPPFAGVLARAGRAPVRRRSYRGLAWAATVTLAVGVGWVGRAWMMPPAEPTPIQDELTVPVGPAMVADAEAPAEPPAAARTPPPSPVPAPAPVTLNDLAGASGLGAAAGPPVGRLPAAPPPERTLALRAAALEPAQRAEREREARERDATETDWRTVSLEEAQMLLGGDLQRVEGLQTLGHAVRAVRGGVEVRTEQVLGGGAILELLQHRLLDSLLGADAVRRGDFVVSGRAPISRDSLRALLLRLH